MRRLRLLLLLLLSLPTLGVALLSALNTSAADRYLTRALPRWARSAGYELTLANLDLEPWGARLDLSGVSLRPAHGEDAWQVAVAAASVRVQSASSVLGTPRLALTLDRPRIKGSISLGARAGGKGEDLGLGMVFHALQVTDGSVDLNFPAQQLELEAPRIRVAWTAGAGEASAEGVRVRWRGGEERLDRVEFSGQRKYAALLVDRLLVTGPRLTFRSSGRIGPWRLLGLKLEGEFGLDGLPRPWIEALRLQRYVPIAGQLAVSGRVEGSTRRPQFDGSIQLHQGRFGVVEDAELSAELDAGVDGLRFRRVSGSSNVVTLDQLDGRLRWDDGVWLQARGRASDYRLRPFMGLFVNGWFPVGLVAGGSFHAEGPLYPELALAVRGEVSVRDLDVTTETSGERRTRFALPAATVRSRLTVKRRQLTFGPSRVETESVDVDVAAGRIVYREGLWFTTAGEIRSLALTRPLLPAWLDARGRVEGRFGGPYRELEFRYDADLEAVTVRGQTLGRLRGRGVYDLRALRVSGAVLQGPWGALRADGAATLLPGGAHQWDVRLDDGNLHELADLVRGLGADLPLDLAGQVSGSGQLVGPLTAPTYSGRIEANELRVDQYRFDRARLEARIETRRWELPWLEVEAYGARGEGTAQGDADEFTAQFEVRDLDLALATAATGRDLPLRGRFDGTVRGAGRYRAPTLSGRGRVTTPMFADASLPDADVEFTLNRDSAEVAAAALRGRLTAWGRQQFGPEGIFSAGLEARAAPWDELRSFAPRAEVAGDSLTATLELAGTRARDGGLTLHRARGRGSVAGLAWRELEFGELGFGGEYESGVVAFHAEVWDQGLQLEGLYSPEPGAPLELGVVFAALPLQRLAPYLPVSSGAVSGSGRALLGWERAMTTVGLQRLSALADLELDATLSGLCDSRGLNLPDLSVRVTSPGGLPRWTVDTDGLRLLGELEDLESAAWRVEATADQLDLGPLLAGRDPTDGVTGVLSGAGSLRGVGRNVYSGAGSGRADGVAWKRWGRGDWQWRAEYDGSVLTAGASEPRGVTAELRWKTAGPLEVTVQLDDVPLEGWLDPQRVPPDFVARTSGAGALEWLPGRRPRATLALSSLVLDNPPLQLKNTAPVEVALAEGSVYLGQLSLAGEGVDVSAAGNAQLGVSWNLAARGQLDLGTLADWLPEVERGQGTAVLEGSLSGPWRAPQLGGTVEILSGAGLKFAGFPIALEDLDARGALEGEDRFTLEWLDAQVREGRLHLEGGVELENWRPGELRFYGEIRDLDFQWPPQVEYRVDADALLTGSVEAPQVRGEVRLQNFLDQRRINWRRLVVEALNRKPKQVESRSEGGVFVDLAVRGSDDIRVENNIADLELTADLRARGYLPDPVLWGRVDVVDGTVKFRGREYETRESTVEFLGDTQPAPQLDLHASTQTRDYTINVDVIGPLDRYEVSLSSAPYLSHTDIVALLTLGMTAEEAQLGGNVAGVEAASILTEGLQEEFSAVGGVLGVDQFHIDPAYSPATQTTVPRVTVGRNITEELSVRYSAAVGADTQQNAEVEFTVNPKLSLLGTWIDLGSQSRGSLGGEVRFRVPFR